MRFQVFLVFLLSWLMSIDIALAEVKKGPTTFTSIKTDTIDEETPNAGVTIDGTLIKDGNWSGTVTGGVYTTGDQSIGGNKTFTLGISAPTLDTGQGANELYDMDQNVTTGSAVTFTTVNTGQGANELYDMDQNVTTGSAVTFTTVNTGQGANKLYDMNQNVQTTDAVTFSTVNTGQGANELYGMNQNVQTTDAVQFGRLGIGAANVVSGDSSLIQVRTADDPGICMYDTNATDGHRMTSDSGVWLVQDSNSNCVNESTKLSFTNSTGVFSINGTIDTGNGATEIYDMNQDVRTDDAVTFTTVNTGQGANELYDMNQNVQTTDAVTFSTVNTGPGATEVHLMNQNIRTTDSVTFNQVTTPTVTYGTSAGVQVKGRTSGAVASGYIGESYLSTQSTTTVSANTDYAPFSFNLPDGVWFVAAACKIIDVSSAGITGLTVNINQFALYVGGGSNTFSATVNRQAGVVSYPIVVTGSAVVTPHVWVSGTFQNGTDVLECRVSGVRAG